MIASKDVAAEKVKKEGVKRVNAWVIEQLPAEEREEDDGGTAPDGQETSIIVNQLACMEAGCPDVELVITLLRAKPRPKLMFKIFKAAADLTRDEVVAALHKALADEQAQLAAPAGEVHVHGHDEKTDHGHHHGDDCGCGHDHAEDTDGHTKQELPTVEHSHA